MAVLVRGRTAVRALTARAPPSDPRARDAGPSMNHVARLWPGRRWRALAVVLLVLSAPGLAQAQTTAEFSGRIVLARTSQGVPGANVVSLADSTRGGETDPDGRFHIPA